MGPFRPGMKRRPSGVCYQQPNPDSRVKKPCPRYGRSERFELTSNVWRLAPKERRNDSERRRRAQGRSRPPDSKMAPAAASRCQDGGAGSRLRSQTIFTQSSFGWERDARRRTQVAFRPGWWSRPPPAPRHVAPRLVSGTAVGAGASRPRPGG